MKSLCAVGKSALDKLPLSVAVPIVERVFHSSNRRLLAGAGLALLAAGASTRSLFRTLEAMEAEGSPLALLAALGSSLPAQEGRVLLDYLAQSPLVDARARLLAREGQHLHTRLVFDALRGKLPEQLSLRCSAALREDFLDLHMLMQPRPRVSWVGRLRGWARRALAA